jgi:adenine-specific DNA methylase
MRRLALNGRLINPYTIFRRIANRAVEDMGAYFDELHTGARISITQQDATKLRVPTRRIDAVVTSPPYHGAVDYYRRHQLEMFWLDLTRTQAERQQLLPGYIGRSRPSMRHPFLRYGSIGSSEAARLERRIRAMDTVRANAFKHYCVAMDKVFNRLARVLRPNTPVVLVVGHSSWNGYQLNTSKLFEELSHPAFSMVDHLWYPVKNRYMSYSRHNDANIDREYVLVLERTNDG